MIQDRGARRSWKISDDLWTRFVQGWCYEQNVYAVFVGQMRGESLKLARGFPSFYSVFGWFFPSAPSLSRSFFSNDDLLLRRSRRKKRGRGRCNLNRDWFAFCSGSRGFAEGVPGGVWHCEGENAAYAPDQARPCPQLLRFLLRNY